MDIKPMLVMLMLDFLWLHNDFLQAIKMIETIQKSPFEIKYAPAFITYVLMVLGLYTYVIPNMDGTIKTAFIKGGLFGFILYGVFDMTNMAIFKEYSLRVALLDILWGTLLFTISGYVSSVK